MGLDSFFMKKLENLYAGIESKKLIGGIDIDWAASLKPRYFQVLHEGETVLFIDLKILLLGTRKKGEK